MVMVVSTRDCNESLVVSPYLSHHFSRFHL